MWKSVMGESLESKAKPAVALWNQVWWTPENKVTDDSLSDDDDDLFDGNDEDKNHENMPKVQQEESCQTFGIGNSYPMYYVSWEECQLFCQKLSAKLGQTVKLPTEAQWEYACQAGTTGDYSGILDEMAWYGETKYFRLTSTSSSHPVGQKKPNSWGLYDMHGNVMEWCSDWYDEKFFNKAPANDPESTTPSEYHPENPTPYLYHSVRGGCFYSDAESCRSAYRKMMPSWVYKALIENMDPRDNLSADFNNLFTSMVSCFFCIEYPPIIGFRVLIVPNQE